MHTKISPADYTAFVNDFSLHIPDNYNFALDFLDPEAAADPGRMAMRHVDPQGKRTDLDLAFFSRESSRLANGLKARGLGKGDRVMLILYRRVEFWVTFLACMKIGAVPVPATHLLTAKDIKFRADFARLKAVVCEDSVCANVDGALDMGSTIDILVRVGEAAPGKGWDAYEALVEGQADIFVPETKPGGDDSMLIFFTSGTTGMPKMVEHTHAYSLGHLTTGVYWHDLGPGDVHLTLADTGWGKALWGKFFGQWLAKAVVAVWDFRGRFTPADLLDVLAEHEITSFCAPPTVYRFLIREDLSQHPLPKLRHCTTAGELLNDGVFLAWKEATGLPIYEGYGQTETCLQIATFPFMTPKPGSIGKPVPGWDLALLDEEGKPCAPGAEGEICIKMDKGRNIGLFTGYLDDPDKTAASCRDGYYLTGDKAWVDEDGYYWFLGRTDDLIKSSGYRIGPFEVESALITHEAVVEAAVTGVPDPIRGQAVKATLVLAPGFTPSDELTKEIQDHVKHVTAPYKYPRVVEYVDELPKTISGKIRRAEIRERDTNAN